MPSELDLNPGRWCSRPEVVQRTRRIALGIAVLLALWSRGAWACSCSPEPTVRPDDVVLHGSVSRIEDLRARAGARSRSVRRVCFTAIETVQNAHTMTD